MRAIAVNYKRALNRVRRDGTGREKETGGKHS